MAGAGRNMERWLHTGLPAVILKRKLSIIFGYNRVTKSYLRTAQGTARAVL